MLIQKLRLQRGWSQEQLAELSGLSVRTIQRLERGQTASVESLKAIASVFEIDFNRLKDPEMDTTQDPLLSPPLARDVRADEALALAHVRHIKGFYMHLAQYVVIIGALAVLNLVTSPVYLWVVWPAMGWGIGILAHGLRVFGKIPFLDAQWERREVEKYLGRQL
jgi:transcriptional regulator with XRE-family HTH domain